MEWVETTGRTVEEAKELALDQLGVLEDDAEFEIVEEPRPGLFGRIRGEARVRARVRPTQPRPKTDRRDRRRKTKDETTTAADTAPDASREEAGATSAVAVDTAPTAADPGGADDNGAGRDAERRAAAAFLQGLVDALGEPAQAEIVALSDEEAEIRLQGGDLGVLIGPRGQTLLAVQDLTRLAAQRRSADRYGRLRVDIAGYRERRKEALIRFTEQVAAEVVQTGTARALEPMSSMDRKVVHDAVNEIDGVDTISEGEDPYRRVVIRPAAGA
jgi:spoIIIJ-associated protein